MALFLDLIITIFAVINLALETNKATTINDLAQVIFWGVAFATSFYAMKKEGDK